MKKIVFMLSIVLITAGCVSVTCPNESCIEQPGVAPTYAPVLVPGTITDSVCLAHPDMMLEAEFQDDTIGE